MNEAKKLEDAVANLGPWNYLIELDKEVFTIPRLHWQGLWHNIVVQDYIARTLPQFLKQYADIDIKNTTIIDIGCNEGWLTTLLWRQGYKRIVGIDGNKKNIARALFLKEHFGMTNVDFICEDIHTFRSSETFDVSIMLGVINHLHNPIESLKNIYSFTNKRFIMDFNAFCPDNKDSHREYEPEKNNLQSVFGNMQCQFEDKGSLTSISEGNLVFQFSRRAMTMLLNFAGFGEVVELLPGMALPPNYKNDKRVYLSGRKMESQVYFQHELMINRMYCDAERKFFATVPNLLEEDFYGYNIVSFYGNYYGVPLSIMSDFNILAILDSLDCAVSESLEELKFLLKAYARKKGKKGLLCSPQHKRIFKFQYAQELILQSKYDEADTLLKSILACEASSLNQLDKARIYFEIGMLLYKQGDLCRAKENWETCLEIEPDFQDAKLRLNREKETADEVKINSVFY